MYNHLEKADFVFIAMGEPNVLQNIHKHLKKPENFSFLQMVVDLL